MNLDKYSIVANDDHKLYEFFSEGPKGVIKKVVVYRRLPAMGDNIFNLGFGDWEEKEKRVNDKVTSNNNDKEKILATVAATVLDFLDYYPDAIVYAEGATPARTRLYQMGISTYWTEISKLFDIYGFKNGEWIPFQRGHNYEAFVARSK